MCTTKEQLLGELYLTKWYEREPFCAIKNHQWLSLFIVIDHYWRFFDHKHVHLLIKNGQSRIIIVHQFLIVILNHSPYSDGSTMIFHLVLLTIVNHYWVFEDFSGNHSKKFQASDQPPSRLWCEFFKRFSGQPKSMLWLPLATVQEGAQKEQLCSGAVDETLAHWHVNNGFNDRIQRCWKYWINSIRALYIHIYSTVGIDSIRALLYK